MKNKMFNVIYYVVIGMAVSCAGGTNCYFDDGIDVGEKHDYYFENDIEVRNLAEAGYFVNNHMTAVPDNGDYWQLPEESYQKRTGDCEDFVIFFMYLAKTKLDFETEFVVVYFEETSEYHAMAKYLNSYFEVTDSYFEITRLSDKMHIEWICTYGELMWMTYYYHDSVGIYN